MTTSASLSSESETKCNNDGTSFYNYNHPQSSQRLSIDSAHHSYPYDNSGYPLGAFSHNEHEISVSYADSDAVIDRILQVKKSIDINESHVFASSKSKKKFNFCQKVKFTLSTTITSLFVYLIAHNHFSISPEAALFSAGFGFFLQCALQSISFKELQNKEKNITIDYSAEIFLIPTQLYLNITSLQTPIFYFLQSEFGIQISAIFDTIRKTKQKWDRTDGLDFLKKKCLYHIQLLPGNNALTRRISILFNWKVWAGISLAVYESQYLSSSSIYQAVILKTAQAFNGYWIGQILYECLHAVRVSLEKKFFEEKSSNLSSFSITKPSLKLALVRTIEKACYVSSCVFTGLFLGINLDWANYAGGMLAGIKREIDFIHITNTYHFDIEELHDKPLENKPSNCQSIAAKTAHFCNWMFSLVLLPLFIAYQIYKGANSASILTALITFTPSLYASYGLARYYGNKKIDHLSSKFNNTLYFYLNFSQTAPLTFIVISHGINMGSRALTESTLLESLLAATAYFFLAYDLGIHAGQRASKKARPYPAIFNPFLSLYAYYFAVNVFHS